MNQTYKETQDQLDPIISSLSHLVFEDVGTKLIGTVKKGSKYIDKPFRSVAYKGKSYSDSAARNAIANDFYYTVVWGR